VMPTSKSKPPVRNSGCCASCWVLPIPRFASAEYRLLLLAHAVHTCLCFAHACACF
jgi:hypothetical protein